MLDEEGALSQLPGADKVVLAAKRVLASRGRRDPPNLAEVRAELAECTAGQRLPSLRWVAGLTGGERRPSRLHSKGSKGGGLRWVCVCGCGL
jgi:hypothetical protein